MMKFLCAMLDFGMTACRIREEMPKSSTSQIKVFTLRIDAEKLERYHAIVGAEHRTIAQSLRLHVDRTIAADDRKKAA